MLRAAEFDVNAQLAERGGRVGKVLEGGWGGGDFDSVFYITDFRLKEEQKHDKRDKRAGRKKDIIIYI